MVDDPPTIPDWLHAELLFRAARAITFLNNLTSEQHLSGNRVRKAAMPLTAFKGAKALVFSFRKKYGFLASFQKEVGFITKKYTKPDGTTAWSPPVFLKSFAGGFGITIGYYSAGYCTAILDDTALEYSLKSHILTTLRGVFLIDMNGANVRPIQMDSAAVDDNVSVGKTFGQRANYFRADAMLLDWSLNLSRTTLRNKWNKALYGNVPVRDVLDGKVPCPHEFISVLDVLKRQTAAASKTTIGPSRQRSGTMRDSRFVRSVSGSSSLGVVSSDGSGAGGSTARIQRPDA
jgi:lipid-binding SYLF domain-containing protein